MAFLPPMLLTAAGYAPLQQSAHFEPADLQGSRWLGRGFDAQTGISASGIELTKPNGKNLRLRLERTNAASTLQGEGSLPAVSNYFRGTDPSLWRRNVAHWSKVRAEAVYPGVDMLYYSKDHSLEFDFVVAPQADFRQIRFHIEGRSVIADEHGNLRDAHTGELLLAAPSVYEINRSGRRSSDAASFRLLPGGSVGFTVSRKSRFSTLVIDPIISYATYLGGTGINTVVDIEQGPDGSTYIGGYTTSVDLPQAVAVDSILNRPISLESPDVFVSRYSPSGALLYTDYVGGVLADQATSMAIDPQGRPTLVGATLSDNFPCTPGALHRSLEGRVSDAFALRISSDGSTLEYSTYLGLASPGTSLVPPSYSSNTPPILVGVDAVGAPVIALTVASQGFNPNQQSVSITPTAGALQSKLRGANNAVLLRLSPAGTHVVYATYYGGSGSDIVEALAVDSHGNAYIGGQTSSTDLPVAFPFQPQQPSGAEAGFFAKINPQGSQVLAGSYFGGQQQPGTIMSIALDASGNIYLGGMSPTSGAPGLREAPGPLPSPPTTSPGTLVKLDGSGRNVGYMWAYSILGLGSVVRVRVDAKQEPCVLAPLQVSTPGSLLSGGGSSGRGISCFSSDGKAVRYATLAPPNINLVDFAVAPDGTAVAAGSITPNFYGTANPSGTPGAPQVSPTAVSDVSLMKLLAANPKPQLYFVSPPVVYSGGLGSSFTLIGTNFANLPTVLWNNSPATISFVTANSITFQLPASLQNSAVPGDQKVTVAFPAPGGGSSSLTVKYVNPAPGPLTVTPAVVPVGAGNTTFKISGFVVKGATVTWNGVLQTVTYLPLQPPALQLVMPASALAAPGNAAIVVTNPGPGGGSASFTVGITSTGLQTSFPQIAGPVILGVGQAGTPITIAATGFSTDVTVLWNGSERPSSAGPPVVTYLPSGQPVITPSVQVVLGLSDVSQMGSASVQLRSGGNLSPLVTAYIGVPINASYAVSDATQGVVYFISSNGQNDSNLISVGIPSGQVEQTLDVGANVTALSKTDDDRYLYLVTSDAHVKRVNLSSFAVDTTIALPNSTSNQFNTPRPAVVLVPGSSDTIIASGADSVLRIFDSGVERSISSAEIYPSPGALSPIFATPDAVWATVGSSTNSCLARLTYSAVGFTGAYGLSCTGQLSGPWELPSPELKVDHGATYFHSGARTLVWETPLGGFLDVNNRDIYISSYYSQSLFVYDLDTADMIGLIPAKGTLPYGAPIAYSPSQILYAASNYLLLLDLPSANTSQSRPAKRVSSALSSRP